MLSDLLILQCVPSHIHSDNGPKFVATAVQHWITGAGAKTTCATPGSPWKNGYIERCNTRLLDELLNGEISYTSGEAQVVIEIWRRHYNTLRPHALLGYRSPPLEVSMLTYSTWSATLDLGRTSAIRWYESIPQEGRIVPKPIGGDQLLQTIEAKADQIVSIYEAKPEIFLPKLQEELAERGLQVGVSGLSRFFKRHGITRKKTATLPSRIGKT